MYSHQLQTARDRIRAIIPSNRIGDAMPILSMNEVLSIIDEVKKEGVEEDKADRNFVIEGSDMK